MILSKLASTLTLDYHSCSSSNDNHYNTLMMRPHAPQSEEMNSIEKEKLRKRKEEITLEWEKIVEAYRKQFGEPKHDINGNIYFPFPSSNDSEQFYDKQAKEGRIFMMLEVDGNGPTGNYFFSIGDGNQYRGYADQQHIGEIQEALDSWMFKGDEEKSELEKTLFSGVSKDQRAKYNLQNLKSENKSIVSPITEDEDEDDEITKRVKLRI
ncbi:hypothetical protein [Legionella cardiaca]|uniref:Uncharacterized protein n=1 Tax=Legionella cardiaca TaxID=1071983 RepID=A0ABY8ARQ7_9GAMM|nr:hypothetical protein [Legionella cardiaca]WED41961.1 hypothetical protein PXX05_08430 [Legionella cardiaca]